MPRVQPLPYFANSARPFEIIAHRPWSVFLDSCRPAIERGRYDILSSDPWLTLTTRGTVTEIQSDNGLRQSSADPFDLLREYLKRESDTGVDEPLPFAGGAIGWFGYDLCRRLERLPSIAEDADELPEMAIGIYDWAVIVDHYSKKAWLVGQGLDPRTDAKWDQLIQAFSASIPDKNHPRFRMRGEIRSNMTYSEYSDRFRRIQDYIREGDCYQVNLTQSFSVPVEGDPWGAYLELRLINPAPYSAYFNTPYATILCSSPEEFLSVVDGEVETRPIKGTRPRGKTPKADLELLRDLQDSTKERAENLMIVDLLRNDLGKVCVPGSIRVSDLFRVESFSTVHHLISTVKGSLETGNDALSLLRSCFPGGSITGAPKLRAMEIIEELEPHRRSVYCGTLGYIDFRGNMDSNILIRTLVHSNGKVRFSAGGGIVADSSLDAEYQEILDKAAALIKTLRP